MYSIHHRRARFSHAPEVTIRALLRSILISISFEVSKRKKTRPRKDTFILVSVKSYFLRGDVFIIEFPRRHQIVNKKLARKSLFTSRGNFFIQLRGMIWSFCPPRTHTHTRKTKVIADLIDRAVRKTSLRGCKCADLVGRSHKLSAQSRKYHFGRKRDF